jgi:fermentation-respiration switch protein FrsA (DUF1100 family)
VSGRRDSEYWPEGYLERAEKERERIVASGAEEGEAEDWTKTAEYVPLFAAEGAEDADGTVIGGQQAYDFSVACRERSDAVGVTWDNRITLQSLYHIARWEPTREVSNIPREVKVLYIVGKRDKFIPIEVQERVFGLLEVEKKDFLVLDCEHLETYMGEMGEDNARQQAEWLRQNV